MPWRNSARRSARSSRCKLRQIFSRPPHQPGVHLKGVAITQMGDLGSGIELLQQAAAAKNDSVDIHNNLGNLLWQAGRLKKPMPCCVAPLISCRNMRRRATTLVASSNKPVVKKKLWPRIGRPQPGPNSAITAISGRPGTTRPARRSCRIVATCSRTRPSIAGSP